MEREKAWSDGNRFVESEALMCADVAGAASADRARRQVDASVGGSRT